MDRRDFFKKAGLVAVAAFAPVPALFEEPWEVTLTRDFDFFWTFMALHKPTGVRYGWKVAEQHLVDRGMTPDEFKTFSLSQLSGVNPYYAS